MAAGVPTYVPGFHDADAVARMKYNPLGSTGCMVSALSFGGSALGAVFGAISQEQCVEVLRLAIRLGVNLLDTAPWYGHGLSETNMGVALEGVPRQAYYLHTKVGRYTPDVRGMFDFSRERVIASVDESLARLRVQYLDCVQVHDPEFAVDPAVIVSETLPALEECRRAGKIRHIGMTGYNLQLQREIVDAAAAAGITVHTCLTYCHWTLLDQSLASSGFLEWAAQRNVGVINASPLAMGLLTASGPPVWHPATDDQKERCRDAHRRAAALGLNISRLAVQFCSGSRVPVGVATTLHSVPTVEQLRMNLDATLSTPTAAEAAAVDLLLQQVFAGHDGTWTGVEVAKYWSKLGRAAAADGVYRRGVVCVNGRYAFDAAMLPHHSATGGGSGGGGGGSGDSGGVAAATTAGAQGVRSAAASCTGTDVTAIAKRPLLLALLCGGVMGAAAHALLCTNKK